MTGTESIGSRLDQALLTRRPDPETGAPWPAPGADRWPTVSRTTGWGAGARPAVHRLFLLGEGIGASRTPGLHEYEGREQGLWLSYRTLDSLEWAITAADLPAVIEWARASGFSGFNVTHPFKQAIIPSLDELSDRARALGAVNTVVLREGRAIGHNTDWCGYQTPFADVLPDACRGTVVQIGAGGAGAAVAYATLDLGTPLLIIHDIDSERARQLVERMRGIFGPDRVQVGVDLARSLAEAEGVVNATPVGMATHPGCAIDAGLLRPQLWVSEIVYFPLHTELLVRARAAGCRTVDGAGMAAEQAVRAFELFTGVTPDAPRMHARVRAMVA
ncbi:shikimate dehydrogenase [Micropruina sp.]|uniref:shikimate dehydrogenase n=1 Tax=Micropruina sp. TaxID=2737536 RepID=UPI0039E50C0D